MTRKWWRISAAIVVLGAWSGVAVAQQSGSCVDWQGNPLVDSRGNPLGTWSWPNAPACTFAVPYPTTVRPVPVSDGTALQNALNNAIGGDVILLTPGVTYSPPSGQASFVLPVISTADGNHWIVVRSSSSAFDPSGSIPPNTRVSPSAAAQMPRLRNGPGINPSASVIKTAYGAHHFRFVGIDIGPDSTSTQVTNMIELGLGDESSASQFPHDIVIDRCYVHGADTGSYRHGVQLNGIRMAVIESYVTKFNDTSSQSSGVSGYNGPGPFKIVNNFIDALGENVIFGGAIPRIAGLVPSDIEVRKNFVSKTAAPGTTNGCNLFELKYAQRVLVDGNIFEKNWASCQDGTAVLLKSVDQGGGGCSWCVTQYVTFRNNIVRHAGACFNIAGATEGAVIALNHLRIENVVCDDITGGAPWNGSGKLMIVQDGNNLGHHPTDVQIVHITALTNPGNIVGISSTQSSPNFVWTYNLTQRQCYGINQGADEGAFNFNSGGPLYPSTYDKSTLVNTSAQCPSQTVSDSYLTNKYPNPNLTFVAPNWGDVQIDTASSNSVLGTTTPTYRLASSSPYSKTGSKAPGDGKDMGADIDAMFAAFNGPGGSGTGSGGTCGGASTPFRGSPFSVPGTFEAAEFDIGGECVAYHDNVPGNAGNAGFRTSEDVDIILATGNATGYVVNNFENGEWLKYTINVATAGAYTVDLNVSSMFSNTRFHIEIDGLDVSGSIPAPNTGSWGAFQYVSTAAVSLSAGEHVLKVVTDQQWFNFDAIRFTSVPNVSTPYDGKPFAAPGTFEAAKFDLGGEGVAYHDNVPGNAGNAGFRTSEDVDIVVATGNATDYVVNNFENTEYLKYTVNVAASGSYTIDLNVSSQFSNSSFHVEIDDVAVTGSIFAPNTGAWSVFQFVSTPPVSVTAGPHVLKIVTDQQWFNLDAVRFTTMP
jgi:hypothetical protein